MAEALEAANRGPREPGDVPPGDLAARRVAFETWARRVGWR
jgi:hypothetical protein